MKKPSLEERINQVVAKYRNDPFLRAQELKKLLKEAEKAGELHAIGKLNMYLASAMIGQGRRGGMLAYAYKAVSIFEETNDRGLLARSYNLLGIAYAGQGSFQRAITMYQKGLDLIRRKNYSVIRKDTLLNNIGDAYFQMGAYRKSLQIAKKGYDESKKSLPENHLRIAVFGLNFFDSLSCLGAYDRAKALLDEIKPNVEALPKSIYVGGYYVRQAYLMYLTGDAEAAAKYADVVYELIQANCDTYEFHNYVERIIYAELQNGDLERARRFSEVLTDYAAKNEHIKDQIMAKRAAAAICRATGEDDLALSYYRQISEHFEALMNENRAIQYESQQSVETASSEIGKLLGRIRASQDKADRDALTGLHNRAALVRIADAFIRNAREKGRYLGGIFIDIDFFKEYNDVYGHAAGDEAIKLVSSACRVEENADIQFFRYGGDEFFGMMLGRSGKSIETLALRISEKIRASGVEHIKNPNGRCLTLSVGVVDFRVGQGEYTILDVIKFADKALYRAKDAGRNAVFACSVNRDSDPVYRRVAGRTDTFLRGEHYEKAADEGTNRSGF